LTERFKNAFLGKRGYKIFMIGLYKSVKVFLLLMLMLSGPAMAGDVIVATGDDLVVYSQDIDVMKDVYGPSGFETSPKEYMDAMLKVRLFAKEALALKLGGPLAIDAAADQPVPQEMTMDRFKMLLQFYGLYVSYIYDRLPISDAAIESYYLAFPEKTTRSGEAISTGDFFRPDTLDGEMKEIIRNRLIKNRKPGLVADEYKRLCEKYHVKVLSGY
jgi:hypothetical protein